MKQMNSGVRSSSYNLARAVTNLKTAQDDTTARMGSDRVGVFGTADPDFIGFQTAPFKTMMPVTMQSGAGLVGAIGILPQQQHATIEDRYYHAGTPFVVDRAGTANTGLNILRNGVAPAGYYGGDKVMVQKRAKQYFRKATGDPSDFCFSYQIVEVRREAKGYALQADERFDGGFYPGSIYLGVERPYGWTFPKNAGQFQYNSDPFTEAGWSGTVNTVRDNPATKPTISGVSPNTFSLSTVGDGSTTITGTNFTGAGWVLIGPFAPVLSVFAPRDPEPIASDIPENDAFMIINPDGAYYYRDINTDGTTITLGLPPANAMPGTYDIIVVGSDGQIARAENAFTFTE